MIIKQKILFTKEECDLIIWNERCNITNWNKNDRKYYSQTIFQNEKTKWIFHKLKSFFEKETGLEIIKLKEKIHFHKYIERDWFDRHNDVAEQRLYAVGVLLNDEFNGGDFILYKNEEILLDKKIGNAYIFDVRIEHEITPIIEGERFSLLWFLQNEHIKFKTDKLI